MLLHLPSILPAKALGPLPWYTSWHWSLANWDDFHDFFASYVWNGCCFLSDVFWSVSISLKLFFKKLIFLFRFFPNPKHAIPPSGSSTHVAMSFAWSHQHVATGTAHLLPPSTNALCEPRIDACWSNEESGNALSSPKRNSWSHPELSVLPTFLHVMHTRKLKFCFAVCPRFGYSTLLSHSTLTHHDVTLLISTIKMPQESSSLHVRKRFCSEGRGYST